MDSPPEGMEPHWAAAWRALAEGEPFTAVAQAAAEAIDRRDENGDLDVYSTGTVAKWKKQWEATYGEDTFDSVRRDVAAAKTEMARQGAETAWWDLRKTEAVNAGVTASQIRARLMELLPSVATRRVDRGPDGAADPIVVEGPNARQVRDLAMAYVELIKVAEVLEAEPPATGDTGATIDDLFGSLRQSSDEDRTVVAAAQLVVAQLRPERAIHVIEATEAS